MWDLRRREFGGKEIKAENDIRLDPLLASWNCGRLRGWLTFHCFKHHTNKVFWRSMYVAMLAHGSHLTRSFLWVHPLLAHFFLSLFTSGWFISLMFIAVIQDSDNPFQNSSNLISSLCASCPLLHFFFPLSKKT